VALSGLGAPARAAEGGRQDARVPDVLARLRRPPGVAAVLAALEGVPGVHVVGGAVRDVLLGREPSEVDLVVEGDAVAVAGRLGGRVVVHERFGTATVRLDGLVFDLASSRAEAYPEPGALPVVRLGVALEEDLARRDFTVNAMAVALADGAVTAWPQARADLAARVLRVLHDRSFADDPTRLLRMVRYAARLGFTVEPRTAALARDAVRRDAPATVSGERLGNELRLALREPQPAALAALESWGLGATLLGAGFAVDPGRVARVGALCPHDARADLAALAACLPPEPDLVRLDALAFPARERAVLLAAATEAPGLARRLEAPDLGWLELRRQPVEAVALAGALAGKRGEARARRWIEVLRHVRPAITGHDLLAAGLSGPRVGAALEAALREALEGRAPTREAQLAVALEEAGA